MNIKIFKDTETNNTWCVRVVKAGDALLLKPGEPYFHTGRDMVQFYDTDYEHTDLGQFVSSYYVDTIANSEEPESCLHLDFGIEKWQVGPRCMSRIIKWLKSHHHT